jgi:subtilase family serine protease
MSVVAPISSGPSLPDLTLEALTHSPSSVNVSTTVSILAKVVNQGSVQSASTSVQIRVGSESQGIVFPVPSLAPYGSYTAKRDFLPSAPGTYAVNAAVDIENAVSESNENNNLAGDLFSVNAPTLPDLVLREISGTSSGVSFTVCNYGGALPRSAAVDLSVNSVSRRVTLLKQELGTGNCATKTESYSRFQLTAGQSYPGAAVADPDDKISEGNESNNSASGTIVAPAPSSASVETLSPTALDYDTSSKLASLLDSLSSILDKLLLSVNGGR